MSGVGKEPENQSGLFNFRLKTAEFVKNFKELQGDPHYIATGMAIGVFISITPTIPFHTVIALALAFLLKGSKPAAAIGVWFCNPVTIPLFYVGSYIAGMWLLGESASDTGMIKNLMYVLEGSSPLSEKWNALYEFMKHTPKIAFAMILGGVVLGIVPGIITYFITKKIFTGIRSRKDKKSESCENGIEVKE